MSYDWLQDFAGSYSMALRFLALQHGSAHFHDLFEMYWLEGKGIIP